MSGILSGFPVSPGETSNTQTAMGNNPAGSGDANGP